MISRPTFAVCLVLSLTLGQGGQSRAGPAKKPVPSFDSQWLVPYLKQGAVSEARRHLVAGRSRKAAAVLRGYLRSKEPAHENQARYLLAHALLDGGRHAAAEKLFAGLITRYPLLVDYHRYYRGKCLYKLRKHRKAAAAAAGVAPTSVLTHDAELLRADALRALGRHAAEAAIWRRYLKRRPYGQLAGKAHFQIGRSLEKQALAAGRRAPGLLKKALEQYKQVTVKSPLWRGEPRAARKLAALAARVRRGARLAALSPWQRYHRTMVFARKMRHKEAEKALAALLKERSLGKALKCKATFHLAKTVFRQRQRARAVPIYARAERACRKAGETDLVVKSIYNGARGLSRRHDFKAAIKQFLRLEKEFRHHSYADDARLWAAEVYQAWGDRKKGRGKKGRHRFRKQIERLLSTLPSRYPDGDQAREALWRLSRMAIMGRRYKEALRYLDRTLTRLGRARSYYAHGQALYWKARILTRLGKPVQAGKFYERCIREYPLSYYSLMAFNRLRERHGKLFNKLHDEVILKVGKEAGRWSFPPRKLYGKPGFQRGVELVRLGLGAAAARELAAVGLGIRRSADRADLWLLAVLFDRAGLWNQSHRVPRTLDTSYRSTYPLGATFRRWSVSYPRAFGSLVQKNARRAGLPPGLVLSIMREESGFSPTIESWANAVGLMQLLLRTAQRAGSAHALDVTRRRLHDPAINIKVGTTYLGFLHRSFGATPLAIAGYNAGEGSVLKWVRRMGDVPLDEFIDRIPFDQTRRYTKRVLSSLFTYSVLYETWPDRVPRIAQKIPPPKIGSMKRRARKKPSTATKASATKRNATK